MEVNPDPQPWVKELITWIKSDLGFFAESGVAVLKYEHKFLAAIRFLAVLLKGHSHEKSL
jgi:hypothetical protein